MLTVSVTVGWDHAGYSSAHPDAAPDLGSPLVVLASLLHCGEFSKTLINKHAV